MLYLWVASSDPLVYALSPHASQDAVSKFFTRIGERRSSLDDFQESTWSRINIYIPRNEPEVHEKFVSALRIDGPEFFNGGIHYLKYKRSVLDALTH